MRTFVRLLWPLVNCCGWYRYWRACSTEQQWMFHGLKISLGLKYQMSRCETYHIRIWRCIRTSSWNVLRHLVCLVQWLLVHWLQSVAPRQDRCLAWSRPVARAENMVWCCHSSLARWWPRVFWALKKLTEILSMTAAIACVTTRSRLELTVDQQLVQLVAQRLQVKWVPVLWWELWLDCQWDSFQWWSTIMHYQSSNYIVYAAVDSWMPSNHAVWTMTVLDVKQNEC